MINAEILETKILNGPNVWSFSNTKLIVLKLRLSSLSDNDLEELLDKVITIFPELSDEYHIEDCSCINTVQLIKHIAIQLQVMAGMPCKYGHVKKATQKEECFVAYEYVVERAGLVAGQTATRIINALLNGGQYQIEPDILGLKKIKRGYGLGPTTSYILSEAESRNIPIRFMDAGSLVTLGYGKQQKKLRTAVAETTSGLGIELAGDKDETKKILAEANVPVPKGIIVYSENELKERIHEVKFPLVVKPLDGNQGRGVTTQIYDLERALFGFGIASRISRAVIVEEYIHGHDHRFLVINYKLVAVARRSPAAVIGNGTSTIEQLISEVNKDPQRGGSEEHVLAQIEVDTVTKKILSERKLELTSVLLEGEELVLKDTANISAGGTATDLTDVVHPENKFLVERIARLFCLDICGVDIITTSVEEPITRQTGAVIEVNAGPGIRMHSNPQLGIARNVAAPIIDMLFPQDPNSAMRVVSVSESSISGAIAELLAGLMNFAGISSGYNGKNGISINEHVIKQGECFDYKSIQDVLFDPYIDAAVLECADACILSSGLPFRHSDLSIITGSLNKQTFPVQELNDSNDLLKTREVLATSAKKEGIILLDADDDVVFSLAKNRECALILFSLDPDNKHIREHLKKEGTVAVIENDFLIISKGEWEIRVCKLSPYLNNGRNTLETSRAILVTVLAAHILNISVDKIRNGLDQLLL